MKNFDSQFGQPDNEKKDFNEILLQSIGEMKKSEDVKKKILAGERLGISFVRNVIEILECELKEDIQNKQDYNEIIYPNILKTIRSVIGNDGVNFPDEDKKTTDEKVFKKESNSNRQKKPISGMDAHERWIEKRDD